MPLPLSLAPSLYLSAIVFAYFASVSGEGGGAATFAATAATADYGFRLSSFNGAIRAHKMRLLKAELWLLLLLLLLPVS